MCLAFRVCLGWTHTDTGVCGVPQAESTLCGQRRTRGPCLGHTRGPVKEEDPAEEAEKTHLKKEEGNQQGMCLKV